ncbi:hypothetical protein Tsubulata_007071 [Turnera subulata]|uniref:Major facilitator superfamily (MFS) profile domain-containing protein n=1 Tax=Turnera subulata TaxID=218843 RepID=A0A9Q0JRF9_9ROSI|nr:hypothetical protein Tsubulata_007071 [Turnera subulata]
MAMDSQSQKTLADFDPIKKPKRNKFAFACAILASMTSVLLGYVMSGASIYIQDDFRLSDLQVSFLVGTLNLYSLVGSAAAGRTSDWIGRRYTIVVAGAIFFVGALLMGFATNYAFLMVGRFVAGVGVGYALMIAPVYTAEVSPASSRGFLTSFPEVFINAGILLGYVSNYAFSKLPLHLGWRLMLGIGAVPSVIIAAIILIMPESPRWLVLQGRLGDARKVLDRTSDSKEEAQLRLADIKEAAGIPQDCNDDIVQVQKQSHGEGVWRELFINPTPAVRHILVCGVGIHFFQQITGIDAVVLYSPRIFEKAGITSSNMKLLATVAVGFVKTIFILVATFLLDRIGRRKLILCSMSGMIFSLLILGFALTVIDHSHEKLNWAVALSIAMVLCYVATFSIGMGPCTWVYSSEIFPLRLRAQGTSIGVAVNRVTSGVISTTFILLYKAITIGGAFFLFASIACVAWVFFYLIFPETRGRTLEDMEVLFGKFIKWRSVGKDDHKNSSSQLDSNPKQRPANSDVIRKPKTNKYAFACAILASMSSVLLGYDFGVMSGAAIYIKEELKISDVQLEVLVGTLNLYCLIGAAAAGRTSDWIGRRYTIVVAAVIFFVAALLMGFATNYAFLMVGRFVAGVGIGYALMIAPVYTVEVSPASSRGFLTSFAEVFINGGILLGYVSNYAFSKLPTNIGWRFMLGIGAIPSVFLVLIIIVMPESPRWLVMQGRLGDAKRVLEKTSDTKEEAQERLASIKEVIGIPQDCNDEIVQVPKKSHGEGVWTELFLKSTPTTRHILLCALGVHFFQQAPGVDAVVLYTPRIFEKAGITSDNHKLLATVAVGFVKTLFILVATFLLDRVGRRPLLLSSLGGMVVSLTTLGFALTMVDNSDEKLNWAIGLSIAMILAFVAFFSIGIGPITWIYCSEIFPLRLRAQGTSLGVATSRITSGVISTTFLSLYKAITIGGAFFLFAGVAAVGWLFFYAFYPETRGRSLEDMEVLFGRFFGWRYALKDEQKKSESSTAAA